MPIAAQSGVVAIAAGEAHNVALQSDGSVVAWGYNDFSQTTVPLEAQTGVIAIAVFTGVLGVIQTLMSNQVGQRVMHDLRAAVFRHLQRLSLAYHDAKGTADSMYRLQYDAEAIENIAVNGVMPFVSSAFTLVAMPVPML